MTLVFLELSAKVHILVLHGEGGNVRPSQAMANFPFPGLDHDPFTAELDEFPGAIALAIRYIVDKGDIGQQAENHQGDKNEQCFFHDRYMVYWSSSPRSSSRACFKIGSGMDFLALAP